MRIGSGPSGIDLTAQINLLNAYTELSKSAIRLSTMQRINAGSDDPAGLIAAESLRSEITAIRAASENAGRARAAIRVADSAMGEVSGLLNTIRGNVVSAAGGMYSDAELAAMQLENDAAMEAINRISGTTSFAGRKLLDGSSGYQTSGVDASQVADITVHATSGGEQTLDIEVTQPAGTADLTFTDVSAASGVLDMRLVPTGKATITWATVTADMNGDGCTDILQSDDQALLGLTRQGGTDRGLIHMFMNRCDGTGKYDDVLAVNSSGVVQADHYALSNWMGFALGNWNCDKRLDMFSTGAGNYVHPVFLGVAFTMEETASKWFMNRGMQPGGSGIMDMQTPGLGPEVVANGFGWGATSGDYDNDGFQDIIYSGGLDAQGILFAPTDRVYMNKGTCDDFPFSVHHDILDNVPNANLRETMASLTADFNNDGFADYLSTSPVNWDPRIGLERYDQPFPGTTLPNIFGVEEDGLARWKFRMDSNGTHFSHILAQDAFQLNGTAVVQMNDARSGNNWLTVRLMGSVGLACGGRVNRAAIGATIHSWPGKPECADSPRGIYAIAGGSSINSQESLVKQIGLGSSSVGTIAIQWPGGHWNVYAGLMAKRRYDILELPCDVCTMSRKEHRLCVADAIAALRTGSTPAGTNLNDLRVAAVCGFLLKEIVCDAD